MILGIGSDLVDIDRISNLLEKYEAPFLKRVFTKDEQILSERRKTRAASYGKRFAAKEACAKALGTGFRNGLQWTDMEVVRTKTGKPTIRLHGIAEELLAKKIPAGKIPQIDVSLSDEGSIALAFVVISCQEKLIEDVREL
ncbi:MAG: holo-ACP synthase [Alphaproteobacteria bacterium]|jgi:holo-[acyl-carrier protein] synthase|nr:holo-ACP synthase [Alphaproteobacteria bacterium]MBT5389314.1 holo-ACP synthase [Alphaproteobacteria bacterium]MBT5540711.1 holo-ACP synthase [Alphaproteobacteria bacterium]MBT5653983.1 holo-ACP synthase [Alphaproteobacteria bacterium]